MAASHADAPTRTQRTQRAQHRAWDIRTQRQEEVKPFLKDVAELTALEHLVNVRPAEQARRVRSPAWIARSVPRTESWSSSRCFLTTDN